MNFSQLWATRKVAGVFGAALLFLVLGLLIDGMIAGGRKDPNLFDLTPGQTLNISDIMPRGTERLDELSLRSSSPDLAVRLTETFSGFWLGGTLWRAEATLPGHMPLGEHTVSMHYQNGTESNPREVFTFRVHKDPASVQAAALSLCTRMFGISPYFLAALFLPLVIIPMVASFHLSRKINQALCAEGMSEIFRSMASPEGQRIFFSVGAGRNVPENAPVQILDEKGQNILGAAVVFSVEKGEVEAIVQESLKVRPGTLAKIV